MIVHTHSAMAFALASAYSEVIKLAIKSIEITNLTNNQLYGFRMFPRNLKGQYQTRNDRGTATATPKAGIPISSLPVGTLIKDTNTKYYNKPIIWKVAAKNHSGYPANSVTLITEKILTLKCSDAKEPSNSNSDRKQYGNNRYIYANIRRWLNSQAGAGGWYAAQHSQDAPPNASNTWDGKNPYETQAGFLNTFSSDFINALLTTTLKVARNTVTDGGSSETLTDKVFLASNTEVGLENENGVTEGAKLALFSDNASRLAKPTAEAISNSNYTSDSLNANSPWYWWLRTPYASSSHYVRGVYSDGSLGSHDACYGNYGVRPLCNIKNDTLVSLQPDTDGAYII